MPVKHLKTSTYHSQFLEQLVIATLSEALLTPRGVFKKLYFFLNFATRKEIINISAFFAVVFIALYFCLPPTYVMPSTGPIN